MKCFWRVSLTLILSLVGTKVLAWGGRGHDSICQAAAFLVKNPHLRELLQNRPHMMGHLCNIPDTYWRSLAPDLRKLGDPGHFINAENLGLRLSELPTDFRAIVDTYTGQEIKTKDGKKMMSVPEELGSNWWRTDQFYRRALSDAVNVSQQTAPQNSKEEQNEEFPYNKSFYSMMINMGLMGHFIGDASQPLHSTSDYDGYAANHGGLHGYYEDAVVSFFDADLVSRIVKKAKSIKSPKWTSKKTLVENMKIFSELSLDDLKDMIRLDPIINPSVLKIEKGMSLKTPAERQPASVGFKKFEKMILEEMARSSYLLAHCWDEIYKAAGEPPAKSYKLFRFPLMPEFVVPDYFDAKPSEEKKK